LQLTGGRLVPKCLFGNQAAGSEDGIGEGGRTKVGFGAARERRREEEAREGRREEEEGEE